MPGRDKRNRSPQDVPPPAYQEGSVETIGGARPVGKDTDDRTGHGQPPEVTDERSLAPDAFVSDEVDTRDRQRRGRPTRTRS
jgi:hypothetical protein